jgi:antitoxin-like ribbon-helix-helix protein
MSKMQNLQQALRQSTGKLLPASEPPPATSPAPLPVQTVPAKQPGRDGHVNISAWLHADFKSSLRLVQARKGRNATLQDLMAEALNDLFIKYDVPTIRQGKG